MNRELEERLSRIEDGIERLLESERAADRLYEELQHCRQAAEGSALKPLFLDLLLFHDSLAYFRDHPPVDDAEGAAREAFDYLLEQLLELLSRWDVEPVEGPAVLDPRVQRVVDTVPTDDPSRNLRVARVLRRGFQRGGRLLRPEEVVVYRAAAELGAGDGD